MSIPGAGGRSSVSFAVPIGNRGSPGEPPPVSRCDMTFLLRVRGSAIDAGDAAHARELPERGGVAQGHDIAVAAFAPASARAAGDGPVGDVGEPAAHGGEAGEEARDLLAGAREHPGAGALVDLARLL